MWIIQRAMLWLTTILPLNLIWLIYARRYGEYYTLTSVCWSRRREMLTLNHLDLGHSNHKHRNMILKLHIRARLVLDVACGHIYFVHCLHQIRLSDDDHKKKNENFVKKAKTMNNLNSLTVAMTVNERRNEKKKKKNDSHHRAQTKSFWAMSTSCVFSRSIDSVIVSTRARAWLHKHNVCSVLVWVYRWSL